MTKNTAPQMYGFYSATAAERQGSCFHETPKGLAVEVTAVYSVSTVEEVKKQYNFDDVVCVGPVTKYLRSGLEPPENRFEKNLTPCDT